MESISTESVGPPGVKPPHLLLPLLLPQPETYVPLHTAVQSPPLAWLAWGETVQSICCQCGWRVFWWLDDWGSLHQWQWGECWSLLDWNHSRDTQEAQTFWNYRQMQLCSMNSCVEHTPLISHLSSPLCLDCCCTRICFSWSQIVFFFPSRKFCWNSAITCSLYCSGCLNPLLMCSYMAAFFREI